MILFLIFLILVVIFVRALFGFFWNLALLAVYAGPVIFIVWLILTVVNPAPHPSGAGTEVWADSLK
jgi:hypothetical protein